ncbi:HAD-IIA family hydrolase [Mycolicibacterium mucogenicum]
MYDCLLLDLDGTVYRGSSPTPGAIETLGAVSCRKLYLTNNAARSAAEVAGHLQTLGLSVDSGDVVTSACSAARAAAARLPAGARVLVVGTDSLAAEIARAGLHPVRHCDDMPVMVMQGHSPDTCWSNLAEAALAIRNGATWIATNADVTFPSERGLVPGNGSMVAALRAATGAEPEVIGKPAVAMLRDALALGAFAAPLVIGDRLDTDIACAQNAGLPSLAVLTGVTTPRDLIEAGNDQRATYLTENLCGLRERAAGLLIGPQPGWHTETVDGAVTLTCEGSPDAMSGLRAVIAAVWNDNAHAVSAGDWKAQNVLQQFGIHDMN